MGILDSALQFGTDMYGNFSQAQMAKRNTDKTIEANKNMAEYAYSKDLEMWNKANQYNSPEAQMLRLKSAGLNPAMVYGSGSVVGNTTQQTPRYQAPRQEYNYQPMTIPLMSMLQLYQDARVKNAQIDNLKANEERVKQDTRNKAVQEAILGLNQSYLKSSLGQRLSNLASTGRQTEARTLNLYNNTRIQGLQMQNMINKINLYQMEKDYLKTRMEGVQLQNQYRGLENKLFEGGLTPKDNILLRWLNDFSNQSDLHPLEWGADKMRKLKQSPWFQNLFGR